MRRSRSRKDGEEDDDGRKHGGRSRKDGEEDDDDNDEFGASKKSAPQAPMLLMPSAGA